MNQVVKNLNVTPTSQILLSAYNDEISLKDKNVSNVLMKRLEKNIN